MTQRQLAAATGVPQPAIARIERGAVSPRLDTVELLLGGAGHALELMPREGVGVDRTLIRAALSLSPADRVSFAASAANNLQSFRREASRGRSR